MTAAPSTPCALRSYAPRRAPRRLSLAVRGVVLEQSAGRGILRREGLGVALDRGGDLQRKLLAELDAPLVERVDAPDHTLREGDVLVQRDELTEHARSEGCREDRRRRAVARERAGRDERAGRALGLDLFGGLAEREGLGLREEVRQEQPVHVAAVVLERVGGVDEADEVGRDQPGALVDQLVERVLPVRAGLAPEDLAGVGRDGRAVPAHGLAVRFHRELLQVRGEAAAAAARRGAPRATAHRGS